MSSNTAERLKHLMSLRNLRQAPVHGAYSLPDVRSSVYRYRLCR